MPAHDENLINNIKVLTGLDAVRMRPEMYLPNYKVNGVRQLTLITFDNFFSPHKETQLVDISISKEDRMISMTFSGLKDMSLIHPYANKRRIRVLLEELHACECNSSLFDGQHGLGAGISVANAFCKELIWMDKDVRLIYKNGKLISENEGCWHHSDFSKIVFYPIDEIDFNAGV